VTDDRDLRFKRNCNWENPAVCQACGDINYEDIYTDEKTGKFYCPQCGQRVRFGGSEFPMGRSYQTPGCPINLITARASFLISLVSWSDTVGVLPTAQCLLDESMFYFEVRQFILSERAEAEDEMSPKE